MMEYSKYRYIKDLVSIKVSGENITLSKKAGCTTVCKTIYVFQETTLKKHD